MTAVTDIDTQRVLKALTAYAARGWHVFPCHSIRASGNCSCGNRNCGNPAKHPRVGKGGFHVATTDMQQIRDWLKRWPDCNWAIACGASRLAVVDVDPRNQGDQTIADLQTANRPLPPNVTALTGGNGQHYLYSVPDGVESVPSRVLGHGVELKADGGYVIAPPSNHVSGNHYRWDAGAHPNDDVPAPLPNWILKLAGDKKRTEKYELGGAVSDGYLGACFEILGWLGRSLGPDKAAARCPNEAAHTGGSRYDSSTVVFAPRKGARVGYFHCSHAHCRNITLRDILQEIPDDVQRKARKQLNFDPEYDPQAERERERDPRPIADADGEWAKLLKFNSDGRVTRDAGNAALLLANLDEWRGCLEYDEFACKFRWSRPVPEMPGLAGPRAGDDLADHHVLYVHHWLARIRGVSFPKTAIQDALELAAHQNARHPVRDYLQSLSWDRTPRLSTWLQRYLGAPDDAYIKAAARWWMVSAVARVFEPGCQADHLLVLEGAQGAGKSTAVKILGGEWYLASLPDVGNKDAASVMQGHWICEIGELDAFRGAAATRIKDWISCRVDSYRPAYGRFTVSRPRQCVFVGTTNETHYLTDPTGARRFWPVTVANLDRDALERDRDQLWAEARHYYDCGEGWHPQPEWAEALSAAQEDRFSGDVWETRIGEWVSDREEFTLGDVLSGALGIDPGRWDRSAQTRAGHCLARLGYRSRQVRRSGLRVRVYGTPFRGQGVPG